MTNIMVVVKGGQFVGIDSNSGGYPYLTERATSAASWPNLDEIERYRNMFRKTFDGASVHYLTLGPSILTLDDDYIQGIKQAKIADLQKQIEALKAL